MCERGAQNEKTKHILWAEIFLVSARKPSIEDECIVQMISTANILFQFGNICKYLLNRIVVLCLASLFPKKECMNNDLEL